MDVTLLILGKVLNMLVVNGCLLYLSMAAHLQAFQIKNLEDMYLDDSQQISIHPAHLKPVIHLVVQSLSFGNNSMEQLNTTISLG